MKSTQIIYARTYGYRITVYIPYITYLNHGIRTFPDLALVAHLQAQVHSVVSPNIGQKSLPILLVVVPFLLFPKMKFSQLCIYL